MQRCWHTVFFHQLLRFTLCLCCAITLSVTVAHHLGLSEEILEKIRHKYGAPAEARIRYWQDMIHQHGKSNDQDKLKLVNNFFNGARFVDDMTEWNHPDYWATPIEFLAHDAGDCEDFSIAKYFTLKEMGMDIAKLRITYVKALALNQAHMVLAYYPEPGAEPLILDNIDKQIRPASERGDLQPVYSFNASALWLSRTRNQQLKAGTPNQIGLWKELTERMQHELSP